MPETGHCMGAQGIQLSTSGLLVGLQKKEQLPGTFVAFPVASVKYLVRSNLKGFIVIRGLKGYSLSAWTGCIRGHDSGSCLRSRRW